MVPDTRISIKVPSWVPNPHTAWYISDAKYSGMGLHNATSRRSKSPLVSLLILDSRSCPKEMETGGQRRLHFASYITRRYLSESGFVGSDDGFTLRGCAVAENSNESFFVGSETFHGLVKGLSIGTWVKGRRWAHRWNILQFS